MVRKSFLHMPLLKFLNLKYSICQGPVFKGSMSWIVSQKLNESKSHLSLVSPLSKKVEIFMINTYDNFFYTNW